MAGIPGLAQLDIALDVIEKDPKSHNQSIWVRGTACGTTACLAGHLAILDGADASGLTKPLWEDAGYDSLGSYMDTVLGNNWNNRTPQEVLTRALEPMSVESDTLKWPDGTERYISVEAKRILGVDGMTASALFGAANSIEEIKRMRDWLAENDSITGFTDGAGYTYDPIDY